MNFFKNPFVARNTVLILGDIAISMLSLYAGFAIRFYNISAFKHVPVMPNVMIFTLSVILASSLMDLYSDEKSDGKKEIFLKIALTGGIIFISLAAFYYFVPSLQLGRGILFIAISLLVLLKSAWYLLYHMGFKKIPGVAKNVLILGTGPVANKMGNLFDATNNNFALAGYVNCVDEPVHVPMEFVIHHGNGNGSLLDIAVKERAHKIVISLSERRGILPVRDVMNCKLNGIDIIDAPSFYEEMSGKLLLENVNPSWFIYSDGFRVRSYRKYFKRIVDLLAAVIGLTAALPLLLVVPVLIKLDSRGPVFFKQKRVGEGEKIFTLYKYRTMVDGAEKNTGPVWSRENDSRITRLGKFFRQSRIDEIPQLFNVLRGDMSFIGPRPERSFFVESLKKQIPYYSERHVVKPGITGWAQVRYEYGDSLEDAIEKLRYDLYYIKHLSFPLDLLIIMDTAKVILFGRGGR